MRKQRNHILFLIALLVFLTVGSVSAAEIVSGNEPWMLEAGDTLNDDLYVTGSEIIIEGTINGDVIAIADYLRVQGEVNGDVIFLGSGFRLDGVINGDVRAGALSIDVQGRVEDDLTIIGSGFLGLDVPVQIGSRSLVIGSSLTEGSVGGDIFAYSGILRMMNGRVDGDVLGQLNGLDLTNSEIAGNVDLTVLQIVTDEESRILGEDGLRYSSVAPAEVSTLTDKISYDAIEPPPTDWLLILRSIVGRIAGLAILGWFILRFRPNWLIEPVAAINARPGWAGWLGFTISTSLFFGSFALAILISFFWGGLAAFTFAGFILMGLGTIWILSPLITGFWLGQRFSDQPFQGLLFGCGVLVILQAIPLIGFGVSLFAFLLALGSLFLAPRIENLPSQV